MNAIGSVKTGGGQYLARTDKITALNGVPPKPVVITAFAKAWYNSPAQQEINAMTEKALKERWCVVDTAM